MDMESVRRERGSPRTFTGICVNVNDIQSVRTCQLLFRLYVKQARKFLLTFLQPLCSLLSLHSLACSLAV